jgi:hypothetical protein
MKQPKVEPASGSDLHLGTLLGRRQAFSLIAGRCSAADAASLREIRDQKSYRNLGIGWKQFCCDHVGMSHTHANRLIGFLDEFGPEYFDLAQLTGISPDEYRAIAPAIKDQAVHYNGQVIALLPENTEKLTTAVSGLRREAPRAAAAPAPALSTAERLRRIERRSADLVAEIRELSRSQLDPIGRARLASVLIGTSQKLDRLKLEFGPMA